ncbi:MAG TPA: Gldg family protein [Bacteroidota bacterium]|nr:Gldg family protein [Bacteroidota bacterium]
MTPQSLKSQTLARLGIVLAILIVLNIISIRLFDRVDLTRNSQYTLSEASKTLVRNLDDKVTVRAYFTEDLPAPYNNNRRALLDELNDYKAYARGNFQFEFIDPTGEKGEMDAQQQGIAPLQVQVIKEDKAQVQRAYMGMVLLYEDKKEVIPVVQNLGTLEYEISSTIKRLTSRGQKKIAFLAGQGEPPLTEMRAVQELMRKQYEFTTADVSKGTAVPQDVAVLVVMAPAQPFTEPQKFQIDQYLMRGGRIAFLLNRVDATLQRQYGQKLDLHVDDMLAAYGLRLNTDLVRDAQCASISLMQQQAGFSFQSQVPFPYLPEVSNFSKGNVMVKDLQGVILFFASSVDTERIGAMGLSAEVLMRSSKQSGRLTGMFMYDPLQRWTREDFTESGIPLAAVVSGRFTSLYQGKPVPADTSAGALPPAGAPLTSSPETRVVLVGDGDFIRDQYMGPSKDNATFFANMIDYLVDDAGLISIRTKEAVNPPLDPVADATKKIVKYADMGLPPLLVMAYGLIRWRMRKARKKAMETA